MKLEDLKRKASLRAAELMQDERVQQMFLRAMQAQQTVRSEVARVRRELRDSLQVEVSDDTAEMKRELDEIRARKTPRGE